MKKPFILIMLAITFIIGACSNETGGPIDKNQLPIMKLAGSFSINVENINEIVGDADYVFVANVNSEIETIYKNPVVIETKYGPKEVSDPYTKYSITIIDNIKGKLKKNTELEILKRGGMTQDRKSIVLYEHDQLLEVGKLYIIAAYAQPDGSLLISGPNSSIVLPVTNNNEIASSSEYKKYKKAFENEIKTDRERFKSSYED